MKIVLDAMGSDHAPEVEVDGAIQAIEEFGNDVILVGDEARIRNELSKHGFSSEKLTVKHASQVIDMQDPAALSVRRKRDSSIVVGMDLLKKDQADAFVSAGNTGAVVCAATLSLRMLPGIERPGIAIVIPTLKGTSVIIDVGANITSKPIHLLQYGIMADAFSRYILGKTNPSVGLLNVGEEESKGTEFIKETHTLLSESKLNFAGNIEGRDIMNRLVDVIVTDGFTGNVLLKGIEGAVRWSAQRMAEVYGDPEPARAVVRETGTGDFAGGMLLGVNGVTVVGHGAGTADEICACVRLAERAARLGLVTSTQQALSSLTAHS